MKKNIYVFLLCVIFNSLAFIFPAEAEKTDTSHYFSPILSYTADAGRNFSGGIEQGNSFMGLIDAGLQLSLAHWLKGGEFLVELQNGHGHNLSSNYVGDLQIASNIENGNYTYLYQLYYKQHFRNGYFTIGIQDLNLEFVINEFGGDLTNSSFGIHATFPLNFAVSIYPKNTLALTGAYRFSDAFLIRGGLWDGDAGSLDDDPYNTNWDINKEQGLLGITEAELNLEKTGQIIKLGGYIHSADFYAPDDTLNLSWTEGTWGAYLSYDKKLNENIGTFLQTGYMPKKYSFNPLYLGGGLSSHLSKKRSNDVLSLGAAYIQLFDNSYECDIELNYKFVFKEKFSVRPCLHYIINPSGTLPDAFASFLRITAEL